MFLARLPCLYRQTRPFENASDILEHIVKQHLRTSFPVRRYTWPSTQTPAAVTDASLPPNTEPYVQALNSIRATVDADFTSAINNFQEPDKLSIPVLDFSNILLKRRLMPPPANRVSSP